MTPPRHVLTILAVQDLARSRRFYTEAFGWPVAVDVPVYVEFLLPGGMRLGLYDHRGFSRNTGVPSTAPQADHTSPAEVYLHCEDVVDAAARLQRAGARLLSPLMHRDWGDEAAYLADPDGHVLVVALPLTEGAAVLDAAALRAIAVRWCEAWKGGDTSILDQVLAHDFVDHSPSGRSPDVQGSKQGLRELYAAFPDFLGTVEDVVVEQDTGKVAVRWSATGTHHGMFMGVPPTHRGIRFRGVEILSIHHGRIRERWGEWDGEDILNQLQQGA